VVLAIALTGLVPTKIAALGIELAQPERTTMLRILAGVIAYLAAAFTVHGLSDYANWRTLVAAKGRDSAGDQLHANQEKVLAAGNEDRRAKITDSFERLDREQQDQAVQRARVGLYKIIQNQEPPYFRYVVWMRVAFDLGVPLILAIATGVVLLVIDSAAPK
jgi:Flp pilus assembly protein TadB